jgi:hypothetical protein
MADKQCVKDDHQYFKSDEKGCGFFRHPTVLGHCCLVSRFTFDADGLDGFERRGIMDDIKWRTQ